MYTFGAPRPGNRAFKEEYDQLVPDTWNCINDAVGCVSLNRHAYLSFHCSQAFGFASLPGLYGEC